MEGDGRPFLFGNRYAYIDHRRFSRRHHHRRHSPSGRRRESSAARCRRSHAGRSRCHCHRRRLQPVRAGHKAREMEGRARFHPPLGDDGSFFIHEAKMNQRSFPWGTGSGRGRRRWGKRPWGRRCCGRRRDAADDVPSENEGYVHPLRFSRPHGEDGGLRRCRVGCHWQGKALHDQLVRSRGQRGKAEAAEFVGADSLMAEADHCSRHARPFHRLRGWDHDAPFHVAEGRVRSRPREREAVRDAGAHIQPALGERVAAPEANAPFPPRWTGLGDGQLPLGPGLGSFVGKRPADPARPAAAAAIPPAPLHTDGPPFPPLGRGSHS